MEWDTVTKQFEKKFPAPSPVVDVKVEILRNVHEKYGFRLKKNLKRTVIDAVADTGCQTTTSGIDILRKLNISERSLVPTVHRIVGITDTRLSIVGSLFLNIECNGKFTNQMVHISNNSSGLYLSESACRDLGIVNEDFPKQTTAASASSAEKDEDEQCKCIPRADTPERPTDIPFKPTLENRDKLKQWLIAGFESSAFNTCTHQPLKQMTGKPMDVNFKEGIEPFKVHTPAAVPHHWGKKVKKQIDKDVRLGIIEPVPQGTPTKWCSRMVVASKKNGDPRRTIDLQQLNKATLRETHHTPSPYNIVSITPTNTYKTVLDAWNGYHSLPVAESAKDAFTFITEHGRYRYCRAPQGFHGSGDAYTKRFDDITSEFDRVSRCIDDSLLWNYGIEDAFWHTFDYLKHCSDNGIVFNVDKFVFAQETCEFAGFELTPEGYRPPKRILDSIWNFPTPKSITDIRSWFGLINQVAYAFSQSTVMAPFRELLSKKAKNKFYWDDELNRIFEESKEKIVNLIREGVCSFELDRVTCLATDWSKAGIGFTLTQKHCACKVEETTKLYTPNCGKGHWKLVLAGSRFTKPAESRYAPIEGEALAVTYGLEQCRKFVLGCPNLIVAVDHKPLTRIFNDRSLESIDNPRLLRMKEKTLMYKFDIIHVPGDTNLAPDAASRYPTKTCPTMSHTTLDEDNVMTEDIEDFTVSHACAQIKDLPGSLTWKMINDESMLDNECARLKEIIADGFPENRDDMPADLRYFYSMRNDLYIVENTVFKGKKMLVPEKLRNQVLHGLHAAHQGISGMRANARERLFWPRLDGDLKKVRDQCRHCIENAPSQPAEPMILTPPPELPFQQVAADFYQVNGRQYLVYADRYTGWTEVSKVPNTSFASLKKCLNPWFKTFGVPEEISSDGGPPFNSTEYRNLLEHWGIKSRLSSAHYPQSNGRAEVAVKTMKRALDGNINPRTGDLDSDEALKAIMTHRNTPSQHTGISPAEMLFGYKLRDHLPNKFRSTRKEWKEIQLAKELSFSVRQEKLLPTGKVLETLNLGDPVSVQNQFGSRPGKWGNTGIVTEVHPNRQYSILLDGSRRVTLRNRRFIRKISPEARRMQGNKYSMPTVTANIPSAPRANADISTPPDIPPTRSVLTSTPRKGLQGAPPITIHDSALEKTIDENQMPENHSNLLADNVIQSSSPLQPSSARSREQTSPVAEQQTPPKTYPKRSNARKPDRYGFQ